jgi:hypothetical protein
MSDKEYLGVPKKDMGRAKSWVRENPPHKITPSKTKDGIWYHIYHTPWGVMMTSCHPLLNECPDGCGGPTKDQQPPAQTEAPGIARSLRAFYGLQAS